MKVLRVPNGRRRRQAPRRPQHEAAELARLPKSGDVWPEAERKLWLELLAGSFRLIYKDVPPPNGGHDMDERKC
jgi:hypothetical protein